MTTARPAQVGRTCALITRFGFVRPLGRGEPDLGNIYLAGTDPVTGRNYAACHAEHEAATRIVRAQIQGLQSWNVPGRVRRWWNVRTLHAREGIPASFLGELTDEAR